MHPNAHHRAICNSQPPEHPMTDEWIMEMWYIYTKDCCCCLGSKLCLTLLQPHGQYPPSSSVHVISQARILEWVAISFSKGSSQLRD